MPSDLEIGSDLQIWTRCLTQKQFIIDKIIGQIQIDSGSFLKRALKENRGLDLLTYFHEEFKLNAIVNPLSC
jgi:hypothetical protein